MTLDETEIAERYGVSRTPVREAFRNLAATGLVEMRAHRSAIVSRPSLERLRGMFDVMAELEALCAGKAALSMSPAEKADLQAIHKTLHSLADQDDFARYPELNVQFHEAIYAGSHNDYLLEITMATRIRLAPFRRAQFLTVGRLLKSFREHDRVVRAILRKDASAAATAMHAHIMTVELAYEQFAASK